MQKPAQASNTVCNMFQHTLPLMHTRLLKTSPATLILCSTFKNTDAACTQLRPHASPCWGEIPQARCHNGGCHHPCQSTCTTQPKRPTETVKNRAWSLRWSAKQANAFLPLGAVPQLQLQPPPHVLYKNNMQHDLLPWTPLHQLPSPEVGAHSAMGSGPPLPPSLPEAPALAAASASSCAFNAA